MVRPIVLFAFAWWAAASTAAPGDSVFVYDLFRDRPACGQIATTLRALRLRETAIVSVEQGPDLVLDWPGGGNSLLCATDGLRASGHRVKVMVLQDGSYLDNQAEALRRVGKVSAFAAAHPQAISGIVIDLEPYTDQRWDCASAEDRRQIASRFRDLVQRLRQESRPVPLEIVVPWWFAVGRDDPGLTLDALGAVSDGIFLMLYGDEGGPVVNGDTARLTAKMDLVLQAGAPRGPFYVALATFEHRSQTALDRESADVRQRYARVAQFAGTAVFHAGGRFDVPLVRIVSGTVTDRAGKGLAGSRVGILDKVADTNACGHFTIRGLNAASAGVTASKPGYRTERVDVRFAEPGAIKELPPIVLRAAGGAAAGNPR